MNSLWFVYITTYLPSSINIVILGSVTYESSSEPPIISNHTLYGPIIQVDREWAHLLVTELGKLICSMLI